MRYTNTLMYVCMYVYYHLYSLRVTGCDLEMSFGIDTTVKISGHTRFQIRV